MTTPVSGQASLPPMTSAPALQQQQQVGQAQAFDQFVKTRATPLNVGWSRKIYKQMTNLIEQWMTQLLPKNTHSPKPLITEKGLIGLKVHGIADRMPRALDPWNPIPNNDLILLGMGDDYPQRVVSITIGGDTTPISYECGQVVARHLNFGDARFADGYLTLADGSKLRLEVQIIKAL